MGITERILSSFLSSASQPCLIAQTDYTPLISIYSISFPRKRNKKQNSPLDPLGHSCPLGTLSLLFSGAQISNVYVLLMCSGGENSSVTTVCGPFRPPRSNFCLSMTILLQSSRAGATAATGVAARRRDRRVAASKADHIFGIASGVSGDGWMDRIDRIVAVSVRRVGYTQRSFEWKTPGCLDETRGRGWKRKKRHLDARSSAPATGSF